MIKPNNSKQRWLIAVGGQAVEVEANRYTVDHSGSMHLFETYNAKDPFMSFGPGAWRSICARDTVVVPLRPAQPPPGGGVLEVPMPVTQ